MKSQATHDLWASTRANDWNAALASYEAKVAARQQSRLEELDRWYRLAFAEGLASRSPKVVTSDELVRITEWKMKRGTYRARNLVLVRGNDEEAIAAASRAAFDAIPDPKKPIAALTALDGVGPATASAVLAAVRPDLYPFFDEVIADQIPDLGKVAFTPAYYARYRERLVARAAELVAQTGDRAWNAQLVGQALWANG